MDHNEKRKWTTMKKKIDHNEKENGPPRQKVEEETFRKWRGSSSEMGEKRVMEGPGQMRISEK